MTLKVMQAIRHRREELKEEWAQGKYTDNMLHGDKTLNATSLGQCGTLEWFLRLDMETVNNRLDDDDEQ